MNVLNNTELLMIEGGAIAATEPGDQSKLNAGFSEWWYYLLTRGLV